MNQDTTLSSAHLERGFRTLSHDWRNVLNGINLQIVSATTAESEQERDADLAEIKSMVAGATKAMAAVIRRISLPILHTTTYPTNFFVEDLSAALNQESDRLSWTMETGPGNVEIDYEALLHAVSELVSNSLRYLPDGAPLQVTVQETPEAFSLAIIEKRSTPVTPKDWGMSPFYTTEKNRLGIGLYYARRVVEAHGGTLVFKFLAADSTLRTTLRLPIIPE